MATLGCDNRLLQAHEYAVNEAPQELEANAAARIRRNGAQDDRTTGNCDPRKPAWHRKANYMSREPRLRVTRGGLRSKATTWLWFLSICQGYLMRCCHRPWQVSSGKQISRNYCIVS